METNLTDADRLKNAFGNKSKAQFVRDTQFSGGASMVSQHMSGNRPISLKAAKIYAEWLNVSVRDISPAAAEAMEDLLLTSTRDLGNYGSGEFARVAVAQPDDPYLVHIRKVTLKLSAGISGFSIEHEISDSQPLSFRNSWFQKNGFNPDNLLGLMVKGNSMEPTLYDGDTVVINTADTKLADGAVFAINYEGESVVKRLVRDIGRWWLFSDNPDQRQFHRKICEGDNCIIIGRVVHKQSDRI